MNKILVTGASGLLGLNIAVEIARDFDVYGVAHNNPVHSRDFTMMTADLRTPAAVKQLFDSSQPDWVIHCAALTDLDACETKSDLANALNAELPGQMAEEARRRGARFLHISTDAVFDGKKGNYSEEDKTNPISTYARTKLAGERAVTAANPDAIVVRVNFFGWSLSGQRSLAEFFFNNLRDGKQVKGFTDVYFSPLLVNDLALLLVKMLDAGLSGLYHVFSEDAISKHEFGQAIARQFGFDQDLIDPVSVADSNLKASRSPNLSMLSSKLEQALGQPTPTISAGVDRFYELYQRGYSKNLQSLLAQVH